MLGNLSRKYYIRIICFILLIVVAIWGWNRMEKRNKEEVYEEVREDIREDLPCTEIITTKDTLRIKN